MRSSAIRTFATPRNGAVLAAELAEDATEAGGAFADRVEDSTDLGNGYGVEVVVQRMK